jgi:ATP/ADP translocase
LEKAMMSPYGDGGPFHWLIGLIGFLIFVIPAVKILRKVGYSGWWVITSLIPIVNIVMFWLFAFARWPLEERAGSR